MSSLQLSPGDREFVYDYSPFLSSTTIKSRISPQAGVHAIPIPETELVSPLARDIEPETLRDMRAWLTGCELDGRPLPPPATSLSGRWTGPGSTLGREKGDEVWKAWKRAWDLWNGYYIEGRVDAVWVRAEYERIKAELQEERKNPRSSPSEEQTPSVPNQNWNEPIDEEWSTDVLTGRSDEMDLDVDENDFVVSKIVDRTPPVPKIPLAREVVNEDGSTGGFMPMKLLEEYIAPDTDASGHYPEAWEDVLASTVWWPRRTGEKEGEAVVGIDEPWGKESEFEFDGGVDCGRSPYPCLRSVIEYVQREGCFLKKKVWDKVTGTVFNMPTLPTNLSEMTDEQRIKMCALHGDLYRDEARQNRTAKYFPLDIRRCDKVDSKTGRRLAGTPLLEGEETLVRWPWNNPEGSLQQLDASDPWYVTDEQQECRLVPPRKYPPGKQPCANGDTLLPTDNTIWKEEIENDERYRSRYFVTNLHGGLLVINGQEVKIGEIAGPLPEFAVIETPGKQFSFWFGPQGRNWKGPRLPRLHTSEWRNMRRDPAWKHVALTAGQVWDLKIRDRLRREYSGTEQNDDVQWAEWKTAVAKETPPITRKGPLDVAIWDGRHGPSPAQHKQTPEQAQLEFSTELEELEWLVTKAKPLKDVTSSMEQDNIIQPAINARWPGPETFEGPEITHSRNAKILWDAHKDRMLQQQREMNAKLAETKNSRAAAKKQRIDAENKAKKRKAEESPESPDAKRARTEAKAQAEANARREKARAQQQLERDRLVEAAERRKAAQEQTQWEARLAAETRQALKAEAARLAVLTGPQRKKAEKAVVERTRREQELRRRQEVKEMEDARAAYNQSRVEDGLPPNVDVSPRTDEEVRLEEQERKARQIRLAAQRKQDELKKQAEELEATRRGAELEKKREEFDRKLKEKEEAEKQKNEKSQRELEAAQNAGAVKFQQLEEQRKAYTEKQQKKEAGEKAKKESLEREKRETLFQDKYGVPPSRNMQLDDKGTPLKNDNAPSGKPSSGLTAAQLARISTMDDGKVDEFLAQMFPHTSQQLNADELLERDVELAKQLSVLTDEFDIAIFYSDALKAIQDTNRFKEAKERLKQRARSEGVSPTQYVQKQGFTGIAEYMNAEIRPAKPDDYPKLIGGAERPTNVLAVSRYWIRRDATEGLRIRAQLEHSSVGDIVWEKGYTDLAEYLNALSDSLTLEDVNSKDLWDWKAFCKRIADAAEWDARISSLPNQAPPQTNNHGEVFAEL